MKKILSTLLVAAMLLSLVIVAVVPASAADGDWTTYATASEYVDGAEKSSVPGYKYTADGVQMVPADWTGQIPFGTIQTKKPYDLKNGLYMEVRVDDYTYSAKDKWININLWSQPMIEPGSAAPEYGHGVQTLFRPKYTAKTDEAQKRRINNKAFYYYQKISLPFGSEIFLHFCIRSVRNRRIRNSLGLFCMMGSVPFCFNTHFFRTLFAVLVYILLLVHILFVPFKDLRRHFMPTHHAKKT